MKKYFPLSFLIIALLGGCYSTETVESTKIPANDVYQDYKITARKDRTSVTATFRVVDYSGATIDLDAPSKIEHNGKMMAEISPGAWKGTTYEDETHGLVAAHQFVYTDANGKTFSNDVALDALEFGGNSFKLSRTRPTLLPLSRSVGADEEISAAITGTPKPVKNNSNEMTASVVPLKLDETRRALVIAPEDLKNFANGRADLSLEIEKTMPLKQANGRGGAIKIVYEAEGIEISIVN
jgi:hypothetical protein